MGEATDQATPKPAAPKAAAVPAEVQKAIDKAVAAALDDVVKLLEEQKTGILGDVGKLLDEHKAEIAKLASTSGVSEVLEEGQLPIRVLAMWTHARVDALASAVERAVGVSIHTTLPGAPGAAPLQHTPQVMGAETAR